MLPYLRLGPFLLPMATLAVLAGVWLGMALAEKQATRVNINPDLITSLIFFGLIGGLIGARLVYAAQYLNAYLANPLGLFSLGTNTFSPGGGLLIGLIVAYIYGRRNSLGLRTVLDALAPGLAMFMVFLGISHVLSGDAFGAPSHIPLAIYLWSEYRQPVQIYEILLAIIILLVILKYPLGQPGQGINFWLVIALSAASRIFLEAFRGDSMVWPSGFRAAQVIGWFILAFALWMIRVWGKDGKVQRNEA